MPRKLLATLYGVRAGLGLNHLSLLSGPCHWRMGELFVPFGEVESLGISGVSRSQTGYCAGGHHSGYKVFGGGPSLEGVQYSVH